MPIFLLHYFKCMANFGFHLGTHLGHRCLEEQWRDQEFKRQVLKGHPLNGQCWLSAPTSLGT